MQKSKKIIKILNFLTIAFFILCIFLCIGYRFITQNFTLYPKENKQNIENTEINHKNSESNICINTEDNNLFSTESDINNQKETQKAELENNIHTEQPVPVQNSDFVLVKTYIPNIIIDLKYATTENFTGQKIYSFTDAYLRYGTVQKLTNVQKELNELGFSLKIWDAFRPPSAQFTLWEICSDSTYVSNPYDGFSSHSRGNTVDITLVDKNGEEVVMPTGFDDFSTLADRDYSDCSKEATKNAQLLEQLMKKHGFKAYFGEWWHYTDKESYVVEEEFIP